MGGKSERRGKRLRDFEERFYFRSFIFFAKEEVDGGRRMGV